MTVEVEEGIRVRITRWFPAAPERVYRAFVDPQEAPAWMWAGIGTNPQAEIDLRVGGRYRIAVDSAGAPGEANRWGTDVAMSGVYVEIVPPHRLVYTLHWEADVGYNLQGGEVLDEAVILELRPERNGTTMVFQHVGIPDDGMSATEHARGIDRSFDLLADALVST